MLYYIDFKSYKIETFVSSPNTSYGNADHVLLLKRLNLLSVEQITQFDNLCVIYKMVNGLAATNAMDLFQPAEKARRYETRSNIY